MSIAALPIARERPETELAAPLRCHALDNLPHGHDAPGDRCPHGALVLHMPRTIWPFKDSHASVMCDLVLLSSATFRMPLFFMIAGFFAALLHQRRGTRGLLADRATDSRPLVVAWLVTFPAVRAGFLYADALAAGDPAPATAAVHALRAGGPYADPSPIHLWFLEYLLIYYGLAVLAVRADAA